MSKKELNFLFEQISEGGEPYEGQEDTEFPDCEPIYYTNSFLGLIRHVDFQILGRSIFVQTVDVSEELYNADKLFVSIVYYSDGDTFGSSHGNIHVLGAFSNEKDAQKHLDEVLGKTKNTNVVDEIYYPWENYFGHFDRTEIIQLEVKDYIL